ncbi:hypothetical protein [Bradyrhizobium japonicum]|uniref:hypothetical protein n=1 Tax=Bradyrhizobium japonicum TaxID=375 RepID=UPI001BAB7C0B|nr:hypothetical protein [Bradyrhizobium japonicum]MBR0913967.1 hypothetical protein [Bradyrhizobium japonicum]
MAFLTVAFFSVVANSAALSGYPTQVIDGLTPNPTAPVTCALTKHRQPIKGNLAAPAREGTVGADTRDSRIDREIDAIDKEITTENKELDRKINSICRGC